MKRSTSFALVLMFTMMFHLAASASTTGGQAAVKLMNASATVSQTINTDWTLKLLCYLVVFAGAFRLYRQKDRTPSASRSFFMLLH